jgi:hypothetical protein
MFYFIEIVVNSGSSLFHEQGCPRLKGKVARDENVFIYLLNKSELLYCGQFVSKYSVSILL